ncbi:transposase [Streptomyces abikoensis]|uniref:transposase n=1 Tax=Streptomyces abikoensis TaxID=97398 RepID=UPI0033E88A71
MELFYLPPRSPELNDIERVWHAARYEDYPQRARPVSTPSAGPSTRPWPGNETESVDQQGTSPKPLTASSTIECPFLTSLSADGLRMRIKWAWCP